MTPEPLPDQCNCPPVRDVFREGVGTKPPCPVHPMPPGLADKLLPAIPGSELRINTDPLPLDEKEAR